MNEALKNSFASQQRLNISRTVNYSENLNRVLARPIEYEHLCKSGDSENPDGLEVRMPELCGPADLRLRCKQRKRFVSREQEAMTEFGAYLVR